MSKSFDDLLTKLKVAKTKKLSVAVAQDEPVLEAVKAAKDRGIAEAILDDYAPNQTVKFYGDIVNSRAEITKEIPVKIGKPRFEKKTIYKNEMIITNASDAYGEDSETPTPEPYDIGAISQAITDREVRLEEEKAKAKQPETATSAATTKARPKLPNF